MSVELRGSQALKLWHDVSLSLVRSAEQDLTSRQLTLLLTVYLDTPPHTVKGLSEKLEITKPAITRALDSLGQMKLLSRKRDPKDRRIVYVTRTVQGAQYLQELGDMVVKKAALLPT
ncbi:MarR family transcriptional regulator [Polycladidibacter stylochi]|uniref:MarR family transcriptional regulator n=1 Tax=Polycladidibacter stylochi TaxID=1807766 RepID=UPI00083663B5|nr:MarR family transcriptional regulator [Pseudovibrio stylochi]